MVSRLNGRLVLCLAVELGDQLYCVAPFISVSPCLYLPILRCDVSWKAPTGMYGLVVWWWGLVYPVVSGEWCYSLPGHRIIPGRWAYWRREANHRDFILNNLLWHQCTDWWNFQVFFAKTIWGKAQGSRIFADGSKDPKGTLGRRENIAKRSQTCYFSFSPNKSKLCGNQWSPLTASVRG